MLQVGKRQRGILDDPAVPKLPGQCQGRVSSYLSCCWVCGAFGCPPSPPELSVHLWKDPKSRIPLKDPSEGRVGFVAITVTPRTKLGWDKVTAPSCTSLEGRGRVARAPERATSLEGMCFAILRCPPMPTAWSARLQDTNPQEIQRCHPPLPAAASTFWEWSSTSLPCQCHKGFKTL